MLEAQDPFLVTVGLASKQPLVRPSLRWTLPASLFSQVPPSTQFPPSNLSAHLFVSSPGMWSVQHTVGPKQTCVTMNRSPVSSTCLLQRQKSVGGLGTRTDPATVSVLSLDTGG